MCIDVGKKVEKVCDLCDITLNESAVYGGSIALAPAGIWISK